MAVDLAKEPLAFSAYEDESRGRISFSDVPEPVVPGLIEAFGADVVHKALTPSQVELDFFMTLPVAEPRRPRYLDALESGELERRVGALDRQKLIERRVPYFMCSINKGDEVVLGRTGCVYFVCRKGCHFCTYRDFPERTLSVEDLAERMLALQAAGADNIQFVSPSTYTRFIAKAILLAARQGLTLPIVHKSEGEDTSADLGMLHDLVDMYLPDVKFITPEFAPNIGLPKAYPKRMRECIRTMVAQVGTLKRLPGPVPRMAGGVLLRHLIMPGGVEEARQIFAFMAEIDRGLPIHVMTTYQPLHAAADHPVIGRHVTDEEIKAVAEAASEAELTHVYLR